MKHSQQNASSQLNTDRLENSNVIKILFVCHGNICRSTMAQYVMQDLIEKNGLSDSFVIDSAATSTEEIGNPVDLRTRRKLQQEGICCGNHRARQMTRADYDNFDYLIGMDHNNLRNMMHILKDDPLGKVSLLLDWTEKPRDIVDPWYSGNFDLTYEDVTEGCEALLKKLLAKLLSWIVFTKFFEKTFQNFLVFSPMDTPGSAV